jgi:O-antigen ligase
MSALLEAAAPRHALAPGRLVLAFFVVALFNYLGAKVSLAPPDPDTGLSGFDPVNMLIQAAVLAMGLGYALLHPRRLLALMLAALPFVLLFAFAGASSLWSQLPGQSLRRAVGLTAQLLFVLFLFATLGLQRSMKLLLGVVLLTVALGLLEAVLRPAVGFDVGYYSNAIRGVFVQKNTFGTALLHGSLALSYLMLTEGQATRRHLAVALVLVAMLVLARSATALVLTLMVLGLTGAWLAARAGGAWLAAALLGAGLMAAAGLSFAGAFGTEGFFDLLGKEETLTGRTEIWASVDRAIANRPWLGHGLAAFWIQGLTPAELIWLDLQWPAPDAHSGWREVVLQLGWVGLAALTGLALLTGGMALWRLAGPRRTLGFWTLLLLLVAIIHGNTESALFRGDGLLILWMLGWLGLVSGTQQAGVERPG